MAVVQRRTICWVASYLAYSFLSSASFCSVDPVTAFIVRADSVARLDRTDEFGRLVTENAFLVGAAVGQLLDTAVEVGDAGQSADEQENFEFAERLARFYAERSGVVAPMELTRSYRAWDKSERSTRREAKALEKQAADARGAGDFARAATLLNEAMGLYRAIGDARSQAVLWGSLGVVCWQVGDFQAVAQHYEKALTARRAIDDHILEGRTLNGLGSVNYQFGNYAAALDFYKQSIELRRKTGDVGGLGTSLTYLGNTYLALGRTVEARNALEEALPLVEQSGNAGQKFEILTSIAGLHATVGRTSSANDVLRDALELAQSMNDPVRQAICHNNLALNLAGGYRYREAFDELEAARRALVASPDPEQLAVFHRNRGIVRMRTGELDGARNDFLALLSERAARSHPLPARGTHQHRLSVGRAGGLRGGSRLRRKSVGPRARNKQPEDDPRVGGARRGDGTPPSQV